MIERAVSHQLAEELFDTFRGKNRIISDEERSNSKVVVRHGHMTNVEGIVAWGEKDNVSITQRLSLGKTGLYYLTTVYHNEGGAVERTHISPNSPDHTLDTLAESLFVGAFKKIIQKRHSGEVL